MEDRREENVLKREMPSWVGRRARERLLRCSCTALVWRDIHGYGRMHMAQMLYMLVHPFLKKQNSDLLSVFQVHRTFSSLSLMRL